jgi:predicted DNA binding CopG/RHH family protein
MPKPRKKTLKPIPAFSSEDQEAEFWASADSTQYIDWTKARIVAFPNLKPSTQTISLRMPKAMLDELKVLANAKDVPYQSLMKVYLSERLAQERAVAIAGAKRRKRPGA